MKNDVIIIGIAGPSASGKSLLANTIYKELGSDQVAIISEDSYYKNLKDLSYEERCAVNYDHPEAFDHNLLVRHLSMLQRGEAVDVPSYDFTTHLRSDKTRRIGKNRIIVLEGILLFCESALRELMDIQIYMDTPLDTCLIRRLKRDILQRGRSLESVLQQYEDTVRPMCLQFIEPSKRYADIIVPRGGENRIAIEMIQAKMRELLVM